MNSPGVFRWAGMAMALCVLGACEAGLVALDSAFASWELSESIDELTGRSTPVILKTASFDRGVAEIEVRCEKESFAQRPIADGDGVLSVLSTLMGVGESGDTLVFTIMVFPHSERSNLDFDDSGGSDGVFLVRAIFGDGEAVRVVPQVLYNNGIAIAVLVETLKRGPSPVFRVELPLVFEEDIGSSADHLSETVVIDLEADDAVFQRFLGSCSPPQAAQAPFASTRSG
jgi:hypothetical protein